MQFDDPKQALRADLLWAVCSPDLMQLEITPDTGELSSIADTPSLNSLTNWLRNNNHKAALAELIKQRQPRRLGIYYEVLWQYVLEHFPDFQLIARNLPVLHGKRTLGELDFVYYCQQRQQHVHLETAVKFYLGVPEPLLPENTKQPSLSWSQWLGPGCKDRLDLKLLKMLNHQISLSTTKEGIESLNALKVTQPLREICLKGYFFYPLHQACSSPFNSHPKHARCHWLKISELDLLSQHIDCWQVMKKEEWLAPLLNQNHDQLLTLTNLKQQLASQLAVNPFPIMFANMRKASDGYEEKDRFFVTPDSWPQP